MIQLLLGKEQLFTVQITMALFWVWLHDLPLDCQRGEVFALMGCKFGRLLAYEKPSDVDPAKYVWLHVELDITKPLMNGIRTKLGGKSM